MNCIIVFLLAIINGMLINNVTLSRFYGLCPFLGVSKKTSSALGMGVAVICVILVAAVICWPIYNYILFPAGIPFMDTITYILVIASLVQLIEMIIKKYSPSLYKALGVYLPLITTNCAVLGVALLNVREGYNLIESVVNGISGALGFTLAIVLFASIRERLAMSNMPKWMNGFPGALITAGLMALAFQGFSGLL